MTTKTTATVFAKMFEEMEKIDFYEQQADELMWWLDENSHRSAGLDLSSFEGEYRYKLNLWAEANMQLAIYYKRLAKIE